MIDTDQVRRIAKLARIEITKEEEKKFAQELEAILKYVIQLNSVPTEKVAPLYQPTGVTDNLRTDEPGTKLVRDEDIDPLLIAPAPETKDRFIKVKSVLAHKK